VIVAMALAVSPRAKSHRTCQRLRSTGSLALRIVGSPVASFQFVDGQVRFKRDAPCHASVLQQSGATRYESETLQPHQPPVVFDTNVLVSAALFPPSIPGQTLRRAREIGLLLTTRDLVAELRNVLARNKFDRYVSAPMRDEFLVAYIGEAEFVIVAERLSVCRDPKDDLVLEAAINGQATCIVSGDDDLLVLHPFRSIPILRPAEFITQHGAP
jgi:uncharacterized protein